MGAFEHDKGGKEVSDDLVEEEDGFFYDHLLLVLHGFFHNPNVVL
jgi:hypothetical protein